MIYGYCRISTPRQNLERQVRNIRNNYPDAVIVREIYTGTKVQGRKEFTKMLKKVANGDTLVFDSVSRMSRTAQEGYGIYEELYNRGVSLVFLKEPHINTSTYQQAIDSQLSMKINTGDLASDELMAGILNAVNGYILNLARKQIGLPAGTKLVTKKSVESKRLIRKYSRDFEGALSDKECIVLIGISRGSYYKYKQELRRMEMEDATKRTK